MSDIGKDIREDTARQMGPGRHALWLTRKYNDRPGELSLAKSGYTYEVLSDPSYRKTKKRTTGKRTTKRRNYRK